MVTLIVVILVLVMLGGIPSAPWYGASGSGYGWGPSGGIGFVLLVVLLIYLFGGHRIV